MHTRTTTIGLAAAVSALALAAHAAGPAAGGQGADASSQLAKLLSRNHAFTATAVSTTTDATTKESQSMEIDFACLDGNVRMDMDMAKSSAMKDQPDAAAQMKAMGMGHTVTIARADKGVVYIVYPGKKAYWEMAKPAADAAEDSKIKIDKKEIGRESIDGHPCVKQLVTYSSGGGDATRWTMWEASDLDGFPVQTQIETGSAVVVSRFKNIKLGKPDASLFEPPAGFKRYESMQEMMMESMRQRMQNRGGGEE
jgi:outer membrane lipoprotein-sorting protein